jgi:hypothetical protein
MDSLKLLQELEIAETTLQTPFLTHLFRNFSPQSSFHVQQAIISIHPRERVDSYDFRPAYHQFSDWLFGWNVSELGANSEGDESRTSNAQTYQPARGGMAGNTDVDAPSNRLYSVKRIPRTIDLGEPTERLECMRMLETFGTQYSMGMRHFRKICFEIEEKMVYIGKNIARPTTIEDAKTDRENEFAVWGATGPESGTSDIDKIDAVSLEFSDLLRNIDQALFEATGNQDFTDVKRAASLLQANWRVNEPLDTNEEEEDSENPRASSPQAPTEMRPLSQKRTSNRGRRNSSSGLNRAQDIDALEKIPRPPSRSDLRGRRGSDSTAASEANSTPGSRAGSRGNLALPSPKAPPSSSTPNYQPSEEELKRLDIDAIFFDLSCSLDLLLACAVSCIVVITFAELINDRQLYTRYVSNTHDLSTMFVSTTLRTIWDLLKRALPDCVLGKDLGALREELQKLLKTRTYKPGDKHFIALSKLPSKVAVFDCMLNGIDVFLFPTSVNAHREGVKSARPTSFDGGIWVTGGYDCKVRIWDLRERNCLAQFVGHKSIVTDVHFTRSDGYIVSSSFDKTIKIWNSQTAICERTLTGHTDGITACDVSPDGRLIVSCGLDTFIRLWDFITGECLACVKKHSRFVKAIRFSPDGRHVASAGLDRRVYIWDVKILTFSKNISHTRCIEAHDDYVLGIDITRPNLLLTTSRDQKIKLWDYISGHCIYSVTLSPAWACTVVFGHDTELFAAGCYDNSVHIFRTKTGERIRQLKSFNLGVLCVRFPKHYDYIVCGTQDGSLQKLNL